MAVGQNHRPQPQPAPDEGAAPRHAMPARLYLILGFVLLLAACAAVGLIAGWIILVLCGRLLPLGHAGL
ncbi:hypothetical protein [Acidisoma sp. C75]